MPYEAFIDKHFRPETERTIHDARKIIKEYEAEGYILTLRQLFYQFVTRNLIPNTERSYKRLGNIISDARLAGLIDWEALEDRTRFVRENAHWHCPAEMLQSAAEGYGIDLWEDQSPRLEVWIEKDALLGVIEKIAREFDMPFFSCRGYVSQSAMYQAAQRINRNLEHEQGTVILHLGDHDPSGIDMTRDIKDRLALMVGDSRREIFSVHRLALNYDQVLQYRPPANPTKMSDTRASDYVRNYGQGCWELDALEPRVLTALIRDAVDAALDHEKFEAAKARREADRARLWQVANRWEEIAGTLED